MTSAPNNPAILIVDDDPIAADMLAHAVSQFGYQTAIAHDGREALRLIRTGDFGMVISDVAMPHMDGITLCREIRRRTSCSYTYLILLTSHSDRESVVEGLNAGADDYIAKPFHPAELQLRIQAGQRLLSIESRDLIIFSLAKLADSRDSETGTHLERIREYCRALASELATWPEYCEQIDGQYVRLIYETSPLHDIGKVGIPDHILLKPGKLTGEEFEIMKKHAEIGGATLRAAADAHPEAVFLNMAWEIAMTHHERWDGKGYPRGLAGERIPLCGRIVAVADVYDALTSQRVYKSAFTHEQAVEIIVRDAGTHFDPLIVRAFVKLAETFRQIRNSYDDTAPASDGAPLVAPSLVAV